MTESVFLWSKTAASNASADGAIGWAEGQAPSSVNNSARSMMAAIAKMRDDIGGQIVSTGSSNEYTLSTNQGLAAHANGVFVTFRADKTSTGAATTTIDGLTQKNILRANGDATESGDIVSGSVYDLVYSTTASAFIGSNVGRQQFIPRSTTAALAAVGNAINTTNKFAGKVVINTTAGTIVTADTAAADGVWLALDGTTAHTPI